MMPTIVVGALHKTESSNSTLTSPEDEAMRMDDHTASWIGISLQFSFNYIIRHISEL